MFPPSADDASSSSARADAGEGKKKSRLTRSRGRTGAASAAETPAKPAGRGRTRRGPRAGGAEEASATPASAAAEGTRPVQDTLSFAEAPAPAAVPVAAAPAAPVASEAPAPAPERAERPEAQERSESAERPERAEGQSAQAPEAGAERGGGEGGGGEGGQPGGGGFQGGGGQGGHFDRGDRGFWKHGKRKRGRHGGPWQPGGGHGGGQGGGHGHGHGGGREQFPPQLPPPSAAPTYGDLPNPARFADVAALDAEATQLDASGGEPVALAELYALNAHELAQRLRQAGVAVEGSPGRRQLLVEFFRHAAANGRSLRDAGHLDQNDRGWFIVHGHVNYRLFPENTYLPESLVRRYGLKRGHRVEVSAQAPREGERCPSAIRVDRVMGLAPAEIAAITPFEELVPYYPLKRILLEDPEVVKDVSMRAVDILTPIGFGQRGLIVAPPRTGKTILLQNIANSISANSPDVKLILLLIDERPEEVTDFRRHTRGEVVSSTFDETPESHVHCAEMVIEICRRRVELGEHVVILLDSITRLARAYNALAGNGGKTMSGGLESNALQKPKRFFGSARNIEGGGSLTIIASALIDTGSRMDEIIFEEFKGTGNSEVHLDRGLVERRIFPAINIDRSGTRKEELIYHPEELQRIYGLRRAMQGLGPIESMEMLITRLRKTKSNAEFLLSLAPK